MTELIILAILISAVTRTVRKVFPGALPGVANFGLRTFLRKRFFGPGTTLDVAGILPGWRILEIGPGWGFLTHEAARQVSPGGEVVGLDICTKMLCKCRRKVLDPAHVLHFVCGDGADLPFGDGVFDGALLVSVIGEVRDRPAMFDELRRCLKPGAAAIVNEVVLDPDYVFPWTIRKMGEHAGLEVVETRGNILCHTTALRKPVLSPARLAAGAQEDMACAENPLTAGAK